MDADKGAGDTQLETKECRSKIDLDEEKAKDESKNVTIDESGDRKAISPSPSRHSSLNDDGKSSFSVDSDSRKYLSIAQIVTNMKARWELFAMENEIARYKSQVPRKDQKYANSSCATEIENTATKSSSAPNLSTPKGVSKQESLSHGDNSNINSDLKKVLSAEDVRSCKSYDGNTYSIKSFASFDDFERDASECKTAENITEFGSITSELNCYTAIESSSEDTSLSKTSRKISKETCNCTTHILSSHEKNPSDASVEDNELSLGQTYTIEDTNCSYKSFSLHTSSSFEAESENRKNDELTTANNSFQGEDSNSSSSNHIKLEELCKDYDSIILAKNEPIAWNVRTCSTKMNQCYNSWYKEIPEKKVCSNVNYDDSSDIYHMYQKICKRCSRGIFPGQAKFENPIEKQLVWHKNCFRCSEITCQKELHNFDHILYYGEPFCYEHYIEKSKASRCKSCYEFIVDETYTYALENYWHQKHFTCGCCKSPLINSEFITIDKNVVCLPCHRSLFNKTCQSCGKLIEIHQRFVHSGDLFWHSNDSCMQCETCSNSLIGRNRFYRKRGHLYCNRFCSQRRGPP